MDTDSDDDMPVLSSVQGHADSTPALPAACGGGAAADGEGKEGEEEALKAAELQFHHPAAKGVLIPHKLFNQIKVHPAAVEPIVRDAKRASALKEQGNEFFKKGQYRYAEECYTEALLTTPLTQDFDYSRAVFFGNRAAVYEKMTLYDKCIADCTEAIAMSPKCVRPLSDIDGRGTHHRSCRRRRCCCRCCRRRRCCFCCCLRVLLLGATGC
jgi:hypothetical protein